MPKQELLAPAGDIEAGYAALYYGADAVYLGLPKFSARATAVNFDEPALDAFTAYAHHLKRKVYVALNTVLQEGELPDLLKSLDICTRCRVDGLIIQDLGVARVMREKYPWFEMHASTQMAVHNKEGALFLQKLGFKRVVLARELTAAEIKEIAAIEGLETEAFIHGALCYSYSGLCQFSAMEHGRSANRGKCLYPCRSCFKHGGAQDHLFSMKDMALQEDVLNMPVTSLKIEGRKKSALYVAAVTDYYRQILDGKGADENREERIKQIFSRPWCTFHFNGKDKKITDRDFVGHRGLLVGEVEKVSHGRLIFRTTHKIARYDGLQIDAVGDEKPFGFSVQKLFCKNKACFEVEAGEFVEAELPHGYPSLRKGDKIYLASSGAVKGAYRYEKPKPDLYRNTHDIKVKVTVEEDKITAECGDFCANVYGSFTPAGQPQKSVDAIQNAFAKTGGTSLNLVDLVIDNKDNLFAPASLLNELRRDLYSRIKIELPESVLPEISSRQKEKSEPQFKIKVDNLQYLALLNLNNFGEVVYMISPQSDLSGLKELPKNKVRIALPAVCRAPQRYAEIIRRLLDGGYNKWEVANYWALEMLPVHTLDISFDTPLYVLNTQAAAMAKDIGATQICTSLEDIGGNVGLLAEKAPLSVTTVIYQDVPLFTSAVCLRDNDCKNCTKGDKWFDLVRDGQKYAALSRECQVMVFDKRPYCLAAEANTLPVDYLRMDFMYRPYTAEQVRAIVEKLLHFEDVSPCMKANFHNKNI